MIVHRDAEEPERLVLEAVYVIARSRVWRGPMLR